VTTLASEETPPVPTPAVPGPEQHLWIAFKSATDEREIRELRDQLILLYSPLVKYVAGRVGSGLPNSVDSADLVSYGVFGLIDAIEKFDLDRGLKFETYAMARIRGAIVDELRSLDWVPRTLRAKAREIEQAYQRLEGRLHRAPKDTELAKEVGMTVRQLQGVLGRLATTGVTTLEGALDSERSDVSRGDALADRRDGPGDGLLAQESRTALLKGVASLPERERQVLALYYFENLNMADIGQALGVSESRICQIHAKAVLHLRARLLAEQED
jgi:RNA polymerase sigma factor FliA